MLHELLFLSALVSPTVWTVDDDGPADFASVADAVAFAQPGDVISIAPGSYSAVTVDKRISLIGQSGGALPQIHSVVAEDVSSINLRRLDLLRLTIRRVAGYSRVEECEIENSPFSMSNTFEVEDAGQLLVRACSIVATGDSQGNGSNGMVVRGASRVHLVECSLRGADASYSDIWEWAWAGWGGTALYALDQSHVTLVASQVQGGGGQTFPGGCCPMADPDYGIGGDGIVADDQAFVDVRGSAVHVVAGGYQEYDNPSQGVNGEAVIAYPPSVVELGGVTLVGDNDWGQQVAPRPFLSLNNEGFPGGIARALSYGEAGQVGVLFSSAFGSLLALPGFGPTALWVDPGKLYDVHAQLLAGHSTPSLVSYNIPAAPTLIGATLQLQAAQVSPLGAITLTNAVSILVGE